MTGRRLRSLVGVWRRLYASFKHDGGVRLGAAIAYYSLFAIAPLTVLALAGAQAFLDMEQLVNEMRDIATTVFGDDIAAVFAETMKSSASGKYDTTVSIIGAALLMWALVVAFAQLHASFNEMWYVRVKLRLPVSQRLKVQLPRLALVLLPAAVLVAVTLASSVMSWAAGELQLVNVGAIIEALGSPLSMAVAAWVSLVVLYRFVPDVKVRLRSVVFPAFVISAAWSAGTFLYGSYLSHFGTQSATGAAGAIFLALVWMNYSARAALLGCWWCRWKAERDGGVIPLPHAELLRTNGN